MWDRLASPVTDRWRALCSSVALACMMAVTLPSGSARAQSESNPAGEEPRDRVAGSAPEQHFEQALVEYRQGRYRAAIVELEAALKLDPQSKDLVYNLALVHEKLAELDAAIFALERYLELETDPKEVSRAKLAIERMHGARSEFARPRAPSRPAPVPPPAPISEPAPRSQTWLIATTAVAATAAVVGTVFGIRAIVLRPGTNTSAGGESTADLRDRQARAQTSADVADLAFAVSLISGTAAAVLFVRDANACPQIPVRKAAIGLSLGGTF